MRQPPRAEAPVPDAVCSPLHSDRRYPHGRRPRTRKTLLASLREAASTDDTAGRACLARMGRVHRDAGGPALYAQHLAQRRPSRVENDAIEAVLAAPRARHGRRSERLDGDRIGALSAMRRLTCDAASRGASWRCTGRSWRGVGGRALDGGSLASGARPYAGIGASGLRAGPCPASDECARRSWRPVRRSYRRRCSARRRPARARDGDSIADHGIPPACARVSARRRPGGHRYTGCCRAGGCAASRTKECRRRSASTFTPSTMLILFHRRRPCEAGEAAATTEEPPVGFVQPLERSALNVDRDCRHVRQQPHGRSVNELLV